MNEVIGCDYELESFSNYFFYEFTEGIEKDNWAEGFQMIIRQFIWLGYDDCGRHFEIFWPVS